MRVRRPKWGNDEHAWGVLVAVAHENYRGLAPGAVPPDGVGHFPYGVSEKPVLFARFQYESIVENFRAVDRDLEEPKFSTDNGILTYVEVHLTDSVLETARRLYNSHVDTDFYDKEAFGALVKNHLAQEFETTYQFTATEAGGLAAHLTAVWGREDFDEIKRAAHDPELSGDAVRTHAHGVTREPMSDRQAAALDRIARRFLGEPALQVHLNVFCGNASLGQNPSLNLALLLDYSAEFRKMLGSWALKAHRPLVTDIRHVASLTGFSETLERAGQRHASREPFFADRGHRCPGPPAVGD